MRDNTNKIIYLDNAATTPMCDEAAMALSEALAPAFFNPSAKYKPSAGVFERINMDRAVIKSALGGALGEIYFNSGGTEGNNTVIFGAKGRKGSRIIIGEGEHDSVYAPAMELKNSGYDVRLAPINTDGSVNFEKFKELLNEDVSLVSIMHVSNETGAINDVAKFARVTKKIAPTAIFHSDGVQAFLKTPLSVAALGVDAYTVTAHKLHGPKGIGALYVKRGAKIKPLILGGGQEYNFRSGTESSPLIHSFAAAVQYENGKFAENYSKMRDYREHFVKKLQENIPDVAIITPLANSIPNILSVAFKNVRGEVLLHALEEDDILVGTGSACASHHESRFKRLFGLDDDHIEGVIRFSFAEENDISEIDGVISRIAARVCELKKTVRQ